MWLHGEQGSSWLHRPQESVLRDEGIRLMQAGRRGVLDEHTFYVSISYVFLPEALFLTSLAYYELRAPASVSSRFFSQSFHYTNTLNHQGHLSRCAQKPDENRPALTHLWSAAIRSHISNRSSRKLDKETWLQEELKECVFKQGAIACVLTIFKDGFSMSIKWGGGV